MPYRIDVPRAPNDAVDLLIELGALDVDLARDGTLAALMPDDVAPESIVATLGISGAISVSPAVGRDADSVWILQPRPIQIGRLRIVSASSSAEPGTLRLVDSPAFGTGLHPTTALCLELLENAVGLAVPETVLDVGTGSGVLALAALAMGVPHATGTDIDDEALRVAAENARINDVEPRLVLARGGPEAVTGTFPLVLANVLAAPLIEMAPTLVRRVGHRGQLVLSGISSALEPDVDRAYRRLGLLRAEVMTRAGWMALAYRASW